MVSILFSLALCKPYMKLKKQGITNTLALPIDNMLYIYLPCPQSEHQKCPFQPKQSRFAIIHKLWQMDAIYDLMISCVILHNMIIENQQAQNLESLFDGSKCITLQKKVWPYKHYMKGTEELEKFARVSLVEHFVNLIRLEH